MHPLSMSKNLPQKEMCLRSDTKQTPVMTLSFESVGGVWSIPSLPSLPSTLSPKVVTLDRVLSMGQIELFYVYNMCK